MLDMQKMFPAHVPMTKEELHEIWQKAYDRVRHEYMVKPLHE